jgi:anti-sigma factor ChrR (cupin superfamily)
MEAYAIAVIATLAGSFGSFFQNRGLERDAQAGTGARVRRRDGASRMAPLRSAACMPLGWMMRGGRRVFRVRLTARDELSAERTLPVLD